MENLRNERVERIMDLVEWFEEFQPNDLEQIERIMLGLRYVDNEIMENKLKEDAYRNIKSIKDEKCLVGCYAITDFYFRKDANKRVKNK